MTEHSGAEKNPSDTERVWLVERSIDDRDLVTLVYASPDGARRWTRQVSTAHLDDAEVTAAKAVDPSTLEPVEDPAVREQYAVEVDRIRADNQPDEHV